MQVPYQSCWQQWGATLLSLLPSCVEEQPRDAKQVLELAAKADGLRRGPWEPLQPRAQQLMDEVALTVAQMKLEELEALLAGDMCGASNR